MCRTNPILTHEFNDLEALQTRARAREREAEVVRRLLPELRKLNRYEARTHATLDRALSEVAARNTVREHPAP